MDRDEVKWGMVRNVWAVHEKIKSEMSFETDVPARALTVGH